MTRATARAGAPRRSGGAAAVVRPGGLWRIGRGDRRHRLDQRRPAGPRGGRRAGRRGARRGAAERRARPARPHLDLAAARRPDLLRAAAAGRGAAGPAGLAALAGRGGGGRGGPRRGRGGRPAEMAERRAGRPGRQCLAGSGPTAAGGQGSAVVPPGKLAGILAEAAGDAVVVGIGVNVSTGPAELPRPALAAWPRPRWPSRGRRQDRAVLLTEILAGLERRYRAWSAVFGDTERSGLRAEYTGLCGTLGRRVRVELPGRPAARRRGRRPRHGRQAAGQRAAGRRPAGGRGRHRAPALSNGPDGALCAVWTVGFR